MAIPTEPTLSTRIRMISRSSGRSAVKSAAYISGTALRPDEPLRDTLREARIAWAEKTIAEAAAGDAPKSAEAAARLRAVAARPTPAAFDYGRRKWNVETTDLVTPAGAPEWARDRQTLWNRVEATERGPNAQVARDFRFSFSYDLTAEQRGDLAREVAGRFAAIGMCCDFAVHRYGHRHLASNPGTDGLVAKWHAWGVPFVGPDEAATLDKEHVRVTYNADGSERDFRLFQPHGHFLLTTRALHEDGTGFESKSDKRVPDGRGPDGKYRYRIVEKCRSRAWNDHAPYDTLRKEISERQNAMLEANASVRRVDHRGYEARRAEALAEGAKARTRGDVVEAVRQDARAKQLLRDPQVYLGVASRIQTLGVRMRDRMSQFRAVKQRNRMLEDMRHRWADDRLTFMDHANDLLGRTRKTLGLEPEPLQPAPAGLDGPSL